MPTVRVTYVCDHDRDRDLTINGFTPVYIRYLRRKIDEPFGVKTITTQRGVGYRLTPDPS